MTLQAPLGSNFRFCGVTATLVSIVSLPERKGLATSPHVVRPRRREAKPMKNALEEIAIDVFDELRRRHAGFCNCSQCRDDVITAALNKIRPRYISGSPLGSAVTRVALSHRQARAELAVVMLDAMRLVGAHPRHQETRARAGAEIRH